MNEMYDESYFIRGKETGKSLYQSYRWLPDLTIPMAQAIVDHCRISPDHQILDYGCARGYLVRALNEIHFPYVIGCDISEWAITNCDGKVKQQLYLTSDFKNILPGDIDWIIAKDVLEHVENLTTVVEDMLATARVGIFVVVPLSPSFGTPYVVADYERDVTHLHRFGLNAWISLFMRPGWEVTASYRVPGVKENYFKPGWETGNGFITARKRS